MRKAERGVLVGFVVAVALALRVAFVVTTRVLEPLRADAGQYAQYAKNLCEHGVFSLATGDPPAPDSFRSPGYPLMLALCRVLAGEGGWQALAIALQVVLGTLTVLLVHRLARRVLPFGPALFAAALCALSPHLVVSSAYVLTECMVAFVVTAGCWLLAGGDSRGRQLAGASCLGFAVLCNESLLFLPFVAGWALWRVDRRRALVVAAVALLPFASWALRGVVQPMARTGSERAVASISHGSYPGMVFGDPRSFGFPYRFDPEQPAFGASWANLARVLGDRAAAQPVRYAAWYLLEKPVWLWSWALVQGPDVLVYEVANSPYERVPVVGATHVLMRWLHAPLMLAAAVTAAVALWRRRRLASPLLLLAGAALGATLAGMLVIPEPRYLQAVRPVLFVLAATGIAAAAAFVGQRLRARAAAPGAPASADA